MSISQGTDVERQPRSDRQALPETNNQSLARSLTTFSTSSRRAPGGPKARRHHRAGRLPATPLRCVLGASLGLAHVPTGCPSRRQQNSPSPIDAPSMFCSPRRPATRRPAVAACSRLIVGYRIAPLAIMEKCGPARHASRAPPASQAIEQARPLRTEPNLGSAAIGAMRRTARALDT
jgi:hypothetical protein